MENTNKCPKCDGEMEKGILDVPQNQYPVNWAKGYKFRLIAQNQKNLEAYRCKNCGYLENYAK